MDGGGDGVDRGGGVVDGGGDLVDSGGGREGFGGLVLSGVRSLCDPRRLPLPPLTTPRWLRWAPHLLVVWLAVGVTVGNSDQFNQRYGLGHALGSVVTLAQGVAVVLALWRPVPAWWLSLAATETAALCSTGSLPHGDGNEPWPWAPPGLVAHAVITLLLALRLPTRVAMTALVVGVGLPPLLQEARVPRQYDSTVFLSVVVLGAATLIGTLLRGRREARSQLVRQETLTAEERARRTLLEERGRIARELHDVVAHHMSVISIQAQVTPHLVENPSEELKENLAGIRDNALEALTELRRVLGVLRAEHPGDPEAAPQAPLPTLERLDALVDNARLAGLTVHCERTGERLPLPPGVDLSAYRIVQEALSNALRHAPGSTVRVELARTGAGLRVRVANTAPRTKAPPSPGAGHGLLGMRERTAMLGGDLAVGATADGGYEVSAFLPAHRPL
ncbi:sensor histidine kinase [Streptomyces sp. DSM 118878]